MSDIERGRIGMGDEDRLPWLEPVEEDDQGRAGAGKLIAAVIVALLVVGLVVGGIFWMRDRGMAGGNGDLIPAPEAAYKVKPDQPGGMKVEGEGDTAFAASDGKETNASIDLSAIPETPVAGAGSVTAADAAAGGNAVAPVFRTPPAPAPAAAAPAPRPEPVAAAKPAPAPKAAVTVAVAPPKPVAKPAPKPVVAAPKAAPAPKADAAVTGGSQIQLGAFSSEAKANAAWKTLSGRFAFLAPLTKSVTPVTSGSGTLYRLRAVAGSQAGALCAKLKIAGETCGVIG